MIKHLHDGKFHYPPGGGTSVFKEGYINYILNYLPKNEVRISVGAMPYSSPHFGTIITFSLAFALAQRLKKLGKTVTVMVGMVDTGAIAPDKYNFDGITFQKSIAYTGVINECIDEYKEVIEKMNSHFGGVDYIIVNQSDLSLHRKAPEIIRKIISEREKIGQLLFSSIKSLGLRAACPQCGLTDRYGIKNCYDGDIISFFCPNHGLHSIDISKDNLQKLQYQSPLRNLVRGLLYTEDNKEKTIPYSWLRVTGSDYSGFYQEQLLYRGIAMLDIDIVNSPLIIYSPLVTDWTGAKLSKSFLVEGGYKYLTEQGLDYFIDYQKFKTKFGSKGLEVLFDETNLWLEESHRLFRSYTIFYFDELFKAKINETIDLEKFNTNKDIEQD
ncbi:5693_t:CDS:1 [Scutellospora calospora]|uniref:5693_t:CDS:1 n=1 Tax=Scutellospora calospora TaxID=85575 RepID=A0ACA9NC41_9GLOM|nr:5693_t:CDS:1 [Scutellospora calospora]